MGKKGRGGGKWKRRGGRHETFTVTNVLCLCCRVTWAPFTSPMSEWSGTPTWTRVSTSAYPTCTWYGQFHSIQCVLDTYHVVLTMYMIVNAGYHIMLHVWNSPKNGRVVQHHSYFDVVHETYKYALMSDLVLLFKFLLVTYVQLSFHLLSFLQLVTFT